MGRGFHHNKSLKLKLPCLTNAFYVSLCFEDSRRGLVNFPLLQALGSETPELLTPLAPRPVLHALVDDTGPKNQIPEGLL